MANIKLRKAQLSDATAIAECWYKAFGGSDLNNWLLPPSLPSPTSYIAHFAQTQSRAIVKGDSTVVVASTDTLKVAGYCTVQELHHRKPVQRPTWREWILHTYLRLKQFLSPRRYQDIDHRFELIGRAQNLVFTQNEGHPGHKRYLYIKWLAVHPDAQRQGIATALLEYAKSWGLPMYLESSKAGERVYLSRGFRVLGPKLVIRREDGSIVEELDTMMYD